MNRRDDPLAWLPPDQWVREEDLDLSLKEIVKAIVGWTIIFAGAFLFIALAAFSGIE